MPPDRKPHEALRDWRWHQKLTQKEVAARARCSRCMVAMIETGLRAPGLSLAKRLAQLTGLPLDSF